MFPLVTGLLGFATGALIIFALLDKARRQWRSLQPALERIERDGATLRDARATLERERSETHADLDRRRAEIESRIIAYEELGAENGILKRDLRNIETSVRKMQIDRNLQSETQLALDERARELGERYLADVEKWVAKDIGANNYAACKQKLIRAIEWSRGIGFNVPKDREDKLLADLKADYEKAVRSALDREEQARIKAQIREEQQREREIQRELDAIARERETLQAALERALADTKAAHGEEIERLKARIAEAEARGERTKAQAELTKAGHIYVISNIGSFGERVYKIGMTRRLDPDDRVRELSDASVPFPFDVHMMVSTQDAPGLENLLHREFHKHRLNKVNPRKEFFRLDLEVLRKFIEGNHGQVRYVSDAEALEYRQSVSMSDEDQEYIERVFEQSEQKVGLAEVED